MSEKYEVFISYRRNGGDSLGFLISDKLSGQYGYKVFYDIESMRSGNFNEQLYQVIDECSEVVVILPPNALDRCVNEDDWLRKEIEYAISKKKNIIPVMMRGFKWPDSVPDSMKEFPLYNGISASMDYFDASIEKLVNLFTIKKEKIKTEEKQEAHMEEKFLDFLKTVSLEEYLSLAEESKNQDKETIELLYEIAKKREENEICELLNDIFKDPYISNVEKRTLENFVSNWGELNVGLFNDLVKLMEKNPDYEDFGYVFIADVAAIYKMIKENNKNIEAKKKNKIMTKMEFIRFILSITKEDYDNAQKILANYNEEDDLSETVIVKLDEIAKNLEDQNSKNAINSVKHCLLLLKIIANIKKEYKFNVLLRKLTINYLYLENTDNFMELYIHNMYGSYVVEKYLTDVKNNTVKIEESQILCVIAALYETTMRMDTYGMDYEKILSEKLNVDQSNMTIEKFRELIDIIDVETYVRANEKIQNQIVNNENTHLQFRQGGLGRFLWGQAEMAFDNGDSESGNELMLAYKSMVNLIYMMEYKKVSGFKEFVMSITFDEFKKLTHDKLQEYAKENVNYLDKLNLLIFAENEDNIKKYEQGRLKSVYFTLLVEMELVLKNRIDEKCSN